MALLTGQSQPAETALKLGDQVILASGGPTMKVIGFSPNGCVWCEWKDAKGRIQEASFGPSMLCSNQ